MTVPFTNGVVFDDIIMSENPENCDKARIIHVEILQIRTSTFTPKKIEQLVRKYLLPKDIAIDDFVTFCDFEDSELRSHVKNISLCDDSSVDDVPKIIFLRNCVLEYHVYQLNSEGPSIEELEQDMPAASHWVLPSQDFDGLWESLIYSSEIKSQLINFVSTTILFSDKSVNSNTILWNRVVLLHGPPGTGKTSLCKALAQKLSVRLSHRYKYGQLIEINSHSLFSKWFSESGKLVMKMFEMIRGMLEDEEALVFILIDEVESLAHARNSSSGGSEPSDAIRVVNALLTQIDQIQRYPNVILLTTSNMTESIDLAFVDRADIKQFIGPPSCAAIYEIYRTCIQELQRTGIIFPNSIFLTWKQLSAAPESGENSFIAYNMKLKTIAKASEGLSGRTLRKLPFLAHAIFVQAPQCYLGKFLDALSKAVEKQFKDNKEMIKCK